MKNINQFFSLLLFCFLISQISLAQNLTGCWYGKIYYQKDTFSVIAFLDQEKIYIEGKPVFSKTFTGNATIMDKNGMAENIKLTGKITIKGVFYQQEAQQIEPLDTLKLGSLKQSKLKYQVIDVSDRETSENLIGTWEVNEDSIPARNISLARCISKSTSSHYQESDFGFNKKKKYKTKVELVRDSSGQVLEALHRKVKTRPTVPIRSNDFTIEIYDSRQQDGDSLTIIFNDKIILHHQEIKKEPVRLTLQLDQSIKKNSLIFYADNLGKIPPNTSVISVFVNDKKIKEINVSSDMESSDILYLEP